MAEQVPETAHDTSPQPPAAQDEAQKHKPENENETPKQKEASPLPLPVPETETQESASSKEESTILSDLPEPERKALHELKLLVREALNNRQFLSSPAPKTEPTAEEEKPSQNQSQEKEAIEELADGTDEDGAKTVEAIEESIVSSVSEPREENSAEEVSIWGIPLMADERSDVVLLKFLRARDLKAKDAFTMLANTIRWRKEFGIERVLEESNDSEFEKVVFMQGKDKEGHPVCYNVYGEFQNKTFSDEEKRNEFLKWRIGFLERSVRKLDFRPGGVCTIVQVNDLNNSPGPAKWELRQATKHALHLLQDNYPEFVAKQVFINVPWWYLAVNKMISPFLTQRTKTKFVVAGPSKSTHTLLRYIAAEQIPVQCGGFSKDGDFDSTDAVTDLLLRPAANHTIEFPASQTGVVSWEIRVVGCEVKYGAEFVPSGEESYTLILQKTRKVSSQDTVVSNTFKIVEPGKLLLTVHNPTSRKNKLLYRFKFTSKCV